MLAADLDGNLDREDEACRARLRQLRAEGLRRVAIATAHPKHGIRVRGLGAFYEVDYLVLENGSVMLARDAEGWADVPEWQEYTQAASGDVATLRESLLRQATVIEECRVEYADPPTQMKMLRLPGEIGPVRLEGCSGSFQLYAGESSVFQRAVSFTRALAAQLGLEVCEVMDSTSVTYGLGSKGDGVTFVASVGSERLFTVAMGDSINDLTMLSTCDLPCAPANALPEVKRLVRSRNGILAAADRIDAVKEVLDLLPERLHGAR